MAGKPRNELLLVGDYQRTQPHAAPAQRAHCDPAVRVFTQSLPPDPHPRPSFWSSVWGFFTGTESEEDEFLEFAEFCDFFFQLADRPVGWDEECYNAAMCDQDFVRFHDERSAQRRAERLRQFDSWRSCQREHDIRSSLWKSFKSGRYKSTRSYQAFLRAAVKRDFKDYVRMKQAPHRPKEQQQPHEPETTTPITDCDAVVLDLRRIGVPAEPSDVEACLRFIASATAVSRAAKRTRCSTSATTSSRSKSRCSSS